MKRCENCKKQTTSRWAEHRYMGGKLIEVCHDCSKKIQQGTGRKTQGDQVKKHCSIRIMPKDRKEIEKKFGGVQAFIDEMIAQTIAS